jgi:hypothetical protein
LTRTVVRRAITTTLAVPLALAALVAAAPGAIATPPPDTAVFAGGFETGCILPVEPGTDDPVDGPYQCSHTTYSLDCATVVDSQAITVEVHTCSASLLEGWTEGAAVATTAGYVCANGAGFGMFEYYPDTAAAPLQFGVWLDVVGSEVQISGSYFDFDSSRAITVRASFPAVCVNGINSPVGYQGTITPL